MKTFWKVSGKVALAVAMLLILNVVASIPIAIVGTIIVAMQAGGEVGSPAELTERMLDIPWFSAASFVLTSGCAVLVVWILYNAMERDRSWPIGWRQPHRARNLLLGLMFGATLISVGFILISAMGGVRVVEASWSSSLAVSLIFDLILFSAVSVGEETFSRGYVYGLVKKHGGVPLAVGVSSLIFAGLHASNPAVFDNAFPMLNLLLAGVMLGLLREVTGGLWAPIGMHTTWNFFQGDVYGFAVSGTERPSILELEALDSFVSGGGFGLEGSFVCTAIAALVCLALAVAAAKRARAA